MPLISAIAPWQDKDDTREPEFKPSEIMIDTPVRTRAHQFAWRVGGRIHPCAVLVLALCAPHALAQSTDAARYVNGQGIEVIQGRRSTPLDEDGTKREVPPSASGSVNNIPGAPGPQAARDVRMQVAVKEQSVRDQDRLAILNEELRIEATALETKLRILQSPALRAKLGSEELQRVQETLVAHEKNVRALNAEIGRARRQP